MCVDPDFGMINLTFFIVFKGYLRNRGNLDGAILNFKMISISPAVGFIRIKRADTAAAPRVVPA